jgi:hypothetical protein
MPKENAERRNYWVVSPNLGSHSLYWRQASVAWNAAFMGYGTVSCGSQIIRFRPPLWCTRFIKVLI